VEGTLLLARRPADADAAWLPRSLAALALRFRDARVRLFVADVDRSALGPRVPPAAGFDAAVLVERAKSRWPAPPRADTAPTDALAWLAGAHGYHVGVRSLLDRRGAPRPAERSPGLVFLATAVRSAGSDPETFDAHWRDRHGPLALAHHVGMCAYEQLPVRRTLTEDAPAIDGVALLHFPDAAAYRDRFYDSEAGRAAIAADTQRFLDLPHCEAVLLGEHWVRP